MHAAEITDREPRAASRLAITSPSRSVRGQGQLDPAHPLPVRILAPAQPSWEDLLVAAGLDRESRELSPAESRLLVQG